MANLKVELGDAVYTDAIGTCVGLFSRQGKTFIRVRFDCAPSIFDEVELPEDCVVPCQKEDPK